MEDLPPIRRRGEACEGEVGALRVRKFGNGLRKGKTSK